MSRQIEIQCKGHANTAQVRLTDGTVLPDVTGIEIEIEPGDVARARISFSNVRVVVTATEVEAIPAVPEGPKNRPLPTAGPGLFAKLLSRFRG